MEQFIVDFTGHEDKVTEYTVGHPDNLNGLFENWIYVEIPFKHNKYWTTMRGVIPHPPVISFEQWRKNVLNSDDWNIEVKTEEQFNEVADFILLKSYVNDKFWQNEKCGFDGGSKFIKKDRKSYGFSYNEIRNNSYPVEKSISYKEFQQLKNMNKFKVGDLVNDVRLNGTEWSQITEINGDSFSIIYYGELFNGLLFSSFPNLKKRSFLFSNLKKKEINTEKKIIGYKGLGVIKTKEEWQAFLNRSIENDAEFEKVYEEEFKKGNLVTDDECENVYIYSHKKGTDHYATSTTCSFGEKLRHLTKEEIEQYKESITISGYTATVDHNQIRFSCIKFTKEQLLAYKYFLEIGRTSKIIIYDTPITIDVLNKLIKKLN